MSDTRRRARPSPIPMMHRWRMVTWALIVAASVGVGFVAALGMSMLAGELLGPFRPEDGHTVPKFVAAAAAYGTWAIATGVTLGVAWRVLRRR